MNREEKEYLVSKVTDEIYQAYPFLWEKFGENGIERTKEDNYHHLDHLAAACEMKSEMLFIDYTNWLNNVLTSRGVDSHLIVDNFERLLRLLGEKSWNSQDEVICYKNYLQAAIEHMHTLWHEEE
ncbi:hypothetical protein [Halobacillus yeomjeoni]|uniref:Uncharacterized protein n=1 Tax=Halobacillus yeomjeoni TaxID=311194 RepID=A0A931MVU0_9BACI|nr:hypothetical protein [Halobacillus yeomjeoni]MBH0230997.1 hypothetical protein [Halobacillus yeomjeoni]